MFEPNLDYDVDAMLEELGSLKQKWLLEGKCGKVDQIRQALTKTIELSKSTAMSKNKIMKRKKKSKGNVGVENLVAGKRSKKMQQLPEFTPPPEPPAGIESNIDKIFEMEEVLMKNMQSKVEKKFKVLDRVKIKTTRFGKKFAKGMPIYTFGTIMKIKGKVCDVQRDDSEGVDLMKSHTDFLEKAEDGKEGNALMAMYLLNEPWYSDRFNSIRTILPVLEGLGVGSKDRNGQLEHV